MKTLTPNFDVKLAESILSELGYYIEDKSILVDGQINDDDVHYQLISKKDDTSNLDIYGNKKGYYSIYDSVVLRTYFATPEDMALDNFTSDTLEIAINSINYKCSQLPDYM
jgi:hypothetical protein